VAPPFNVPHFKGFLNLTFDFNGPKLITSVQEITQYNVQSNCSAKEIRIRVSPYVIFG
jgi:hypothetical protein